MVNLPLNKMPQQVDKEQFKFLLQSINNTCKSLNQTNVGGEYIVQDGPPYANGPLHLGHLVNKTLKDIIVKFKLQVEKVPVQFKFGYDCHGLPIELLGNSQEEWNNISDKWIGEQYKTLVKFGIFPQKGMYKTKDKKFKKRELKLFKRLLKEGKIYKDEKVVWYSPTLKTALANSQLEYKDVAVEAVYAKVGPYVVYTTTEWTLPANQGIAINPNIDYVNTEYGIVSKSFATAKGWKGTSVTKFPSYAGVVIQDADFVKEGVGTGVVHLCGGHGKEDHELLKKHGIAPKVVGDASTIRTLMKAYKYPYVVERIGIIHSYPFDDRSKEPACQMLSEQYFVKLDKDLLKAKAKEIQMSSSNREKLLKFLSDREEWCISRSRSLGVKIDKEFVLDVWFDSGSVFTINDVPADIYIEGVDQYRGWFQSSLILAAHLNRIPAKRIVSHGFILDQYKEKLSKSKGNFVSLNELYDKYNPDVLRLWVAMSSWKNTDIVFSEEALTSSTKMYFKLRNYLRYFVNNVQSSEATASPETEELKNLRIEVKKLYEELEFRKVIDKIYSFLQKTSSSLTEDIKNRFYEMELNSTERLQIENYFLTLKCVIGELLFPILPFLISEINGHSNC